MIRQPMSAVDLKEGMRVIAVTWDDFNTYRLNPEFGPGTGLVLHNSPGDVMVQWGQWGYGSFSIFNHLHFWHQLLIVETGLDVVLDMVE